MNTKELMIGIPTKDHPKYIQYYLAKTLCASRKYGIDICVYDSSESDDTKKIVMDRISKGYDNLFYKRYAPDLLPEKKIKSILVGSGYDYVWLCGDGIVIDIEKTISIVEKEIRLKRDLIVFSFFNKYGHYKVYDNPVEMIVETWNPVSLYGGAIYNGSLFSEQEWNRLFNRYTDNVQLAGLFDLLIEKGVNAVAIETTFFIPNPYKNEATWIMNGKLLEVEVDHIPKAVEKLPKQYDDVKSVVKRLFADNGNTFTVKKSWYLRKYDNLNVKKFLIYRKEIKNITNTPLVWFFFLSLVPRKLAEKISKIFSE